MLSLSTRSFGKRNRNNTKKKEKNNQARRSHGDCYGFGRQNRETQNLKKKEKKRVHVIYFARPSGIKWGAIFLSAKTELVGFVVCCLLFCMYNRMDRMEECSSRQKNWENKGALAREIEEGSIMGVLKYLGEGKDPNNQCNSFFPTKTLIFLAIEMYCSTPGEQRLQIIQALIDKGANLGHIHDGETPLLFANRKWASSELLFLLIRGGANPNCYSYLQDGNTYPFLASCSHVSMDVLRELVELGADPMVEMKWKLENGDVFVGPMLECFQKGYLKFEYSHEEVLETLEICAGSRVKG